jgi:aconitate hydratase
VDIDLRTEPLGSGKDGRPVFLKDLWPSAKEIADVVEKNISPALFHERYGEIFKGDEMWNRIKVAEGELYEWHEKSTYIHEPPFFQNLTREPAPLSDVRGARVLIKLADSVTTDHISPAGSIKADSPAGKFLQAEGVSKNDFNSYGSRRGNDLVMTRGTFANIRIRNLLIPGSEGPETIYFPTGEHMSIFDAAEKYTASRTPTIVLAGAEYGTGSSRDWAAKGTLLLGVKAVIAVNFERIHRSNLVGMGVLPLQFLDGQSHESLGLSGDETYDVLGVAAGIQPKQKLTVKATSPSGQAREFQVICRIDTPVEVDYYRNGGILQTVLRSFLAG